MANLAQFLHALSVALACRTVVEQLIEVAAFRLVSLTRVPP